MTRKRATKSSVRQSARRRQEIRAQQRRSSITWGAIALVVVVLLAALVYFVFFNPGSETLDARPLADVPPVERNDYYSAYPEMVIDPLNDYEAVIHTSKGEIRLELFPDIAPLAVNNFVFLARQGFYDGLAFHRVMADFMAQGGDPLGNGRGGPGYSFADEFDENLLFDRAGLLAMANSGVNTNGSQFFITYSPQLHLNGLHTIFGELISGEEALRALNLVLPGETGGLQPDTIERVDIIESSPE